MPSLLLLSVNTFTFSLSISSLESRKRKGLDNALNFVLGINCLQTYVRNSRNLEIFMKSWVPAEARPKGLLFICHGYGDTVTFFNEGKQ